MQIIDFEKKGNVVRFYLGDATKPYWGDDWGKKPYDANAGRVYDKFIKGHRDIAFPFNDLVLEPCDRSFFSGNFSKKDMVKRKVPCIIVVTKDGDKMQRYYFGDEMELTQRTVKTSPRTIALAQPNLRRTSNGSNRKVSTIGI